jgi:hypothetical protein
VSADLRGFFGREIVQTVAITGPRLPESITFRGKRPENPTRLGVNDRVLRRGKEDPRAIWRQLRQSAAPGGETSRQLLDLAGNSPDLIQHNLLTLGVQNK